MSLSKPGIPCLQVQSAYPESLATSYLKQLYISNKTEYFSYKGGCGIRGHVHIEEFKIRVNVEYKMVIHDCNICSTWF